MSLKDILVHLDSTPRTAARLALAADLATRHGAHLTGLAIADVPSADEFRGNAMPLLPGTPEEVVQQMRGDALAALAPVETQFRDVLRRNELPGEWRLAEGNRTALLALHARYADLTVIGQPNRYERPDSADDAMIEMALMTSGRPVLAIPFAGTFTTLGQHVLVAWNAGREATRAVHDALPLLTRSDRVTVLAINPRAGFHGHGDVPAADIATHLARHGVRAEASYTVAKDISDGAALLSYAADIGADLIVAGAYGHSRMREMVFGGVTRTLLQEMTVPVLLSH